MPLVCIINAVLTRTAFS